MVFFSSALPRHQPQGGESRTLPSPYRTPPHAIADRDRSVFWLDGALGSQLRLDGMICCINARNIARQLKHTSLLQGGRGVDKAACQIACPRPDPSRDHAHPSHCGRAQGGRGLATLFASGGSGGIGRACISQIVLPPRQPDLAVRQPPRYELGHSHMMTKLIRMEDANDTGGLWVCGNYRGLECP
jgi:hypothetical protein